MRRFPIRLECSACATQHDARRLQNLCTKCSGPLLVQYQVTKDRDLRDEIRSRAATMWRYRELLPIEPDDEVVTLGEGVTPLLRSRVTAGLTIKDESKNPTRSFKSRGMACAVRTSTSSSATAAFRPA